MNDLMLPFNPPPAALPPALLPRPGDVPLPRVQMPAREQPRERLERLGADALSAAEIVAIILRSGNGALGATATDLANTLLSQYGSLTALAAANLADLATVPGIKAEKAAAIVAAFCLARRLTEECLLEPPLLEEPDAVARFMRERVRALPCETFQILLVNTRRRLIRIEKIADGTLDTLLIHPREVFYHAITHRAAGIVLVHNHPSGDPTPSDADIKVTRELVRAGTLMKIEVLDHVIIGRATIERPKDYVSLKDLNYFYN